MQKQLNLIPNEMSVPVKVVNLNNALTKLNRFMVFTLILVVAGLISGFVFLNYEYKKTIANVELLKNQVLDLEKSEQKLVLAKDKLSKISSVLKIESIDDEIKDFTDFEELLSEDPSSILNEVSISPNKTETTLNFGNSGSLGAVLGSLSLLSEYKEIVLSAFGFNSNSGYLVSLLFNK